MQLLQADLFVNDASEHISRVFGFFFVQNMKTNSELIFYQYGPDHFSLSEK